MRGFIFGLRDWQCTNICDDLYSPLDFGTVMPGGAHVPAMVRHRSSTGLVRAADHTRSTRPPPPVCRPTRRLRLGPIARASGRCADTRQARGEASAEPRNTPLNRCISSRAAARPSVLALALFLAAALLLIVGA